MKKILSIMIIFCLAMSGFVALAENEELFIVVDEQKLPETYVEPAISLFSVEKTLADTLVEGWNDFSQQIFVSEYGLTTDEFKKAYWGILNNNPKFYYVGDKISVVISNGIAVCVIPTYDETDIEVISKTWDDVDKATDEIMMCLDERMTDFEKVMTVHDYMVLHYEYDFTKSNHNITIMLTKTGVCDAYALAFKHLMNELGIECAVVSSKEMVHAWNLVKIDGSWYHIDLTWDDPGNEFGQVSHKYALLSDEEIQHLSNPHLGYDLGDLEAGSSEFDDDGWHVGIGSVATIDGIYYYEKDMDIVDQNGKVIYENLDGGDDSWKIGDGYIIKGGNYAGMAEYNGVLYFNTDEAIYSYDPKSEKLTKVLDHIGVCGMVINGNFLEYCKYNPDKYVLEDDEERKELFIEAGKLKLGNIRFGGTFHKNGKIIKRIYTEDDADDIYVYADCEHCTKLQKITEAGISKISFDTKDCQTLFFWDKNMKPLKEKEVYTGF